LLPVLSLSAADTVSQGAYLALEEERRLLRHLTVDLVGHPRRAPLRVVEVCGVGDPATVAGLGGDHPEVLPALVVAVPEEGEGAAGHLTSSRRAGAGPTVQPSPQRFAKSAGIDPYLEHFT
jgi:hypothetical protein